jgi:hypothetical protein
MILPPFVQQIFSSLTEKLDGNLKHLDCIQKEAHLANRYNAFSLGVLPEQDDLGSNRNFYRVPYVREAHTAQASEITDRILVPVRQDAGYYPRDGSIANLGDEEFQFIVTSKDGNSERITCLPGTNYTISTPVKEITILELNSNPARYQIYLN